MQNLEEPEDYSIYCLCSSQSNGLLAGLDRYGIIRYWDRIFSNKIVKVLIIYFCIQFIIQFFTTTLWIITNKSWKHNKLLSKRLIKFIALEETLTGIYNYFCFITCRIERNPLRIISVSTLQA